MLSLRLSCAFAGAALLASACGGTSVGTVPGDDGTQTIQGPTSPGTPAGTPSSSAPAKPSKPPPSTPVSGDDDATQCSPITINGPVVGASQIAANAPAPAGGTIADGNYHLTNVTLYTGPGGATGVLPLTLQENVSIHGGTANMIELANGKMTWGKYQVATVNDVATFSQSCPNADGARTAHFSATASSLVLFLDNDVGQTVTYTYAP